MEQGWSTPLEDALRAQLLDTLFHRSPDGIVITDAQERILDVNRAWEDLTGYRRDEVVGLTPRLLKSGKTEPRVYQAMWEALRSRGCWQGTFIDRRKSGEEFYAFFSTVRLGDADRPRLYVGFMRDVTEMVRAGEELSRRLREVRATQRVTVRTLAVVAEHRDPDIAGHLDRVCAFSLLLADALQQMGNWDAPVSDAFREALGPASLLHDTGKVGIPEGILWKPAPLHPTERALMELHTVIGAELLRQADEALQAELGLGGTFLSMAVDVALGHHEWWDGSGYPHRRRGREIPPAARIVALADVYDALTSRRSYREPWSLEEAARLIQERAGSQFDPAVVEAFRRVRGEFEATKRSGRPPARCP